MDAERALADLMEVSSQVEAAVVLGGSGEASAWSGADLDAAGALARAASELLESAERVRSEDGAPRLTQLEAATRDGSLFVVRQGGRTIAATTPPSPTVGLVLYDLKTCLRTLGDEPKPKRRRRRKANGGDERS